MRKKKLSKTEKRLETLLAKTKEQKDEVIKKLSEYPIVETACKKVGVGRSTYYLWRSEDEEFRALADQALKDGRHFVSDMAESMLIKNIQNGENPAIFFWLKHNDKRYSDRLFRFETDDDAKRITKEQSEQISIALMNIGLGHMLNLTDEERKWIEVLRHEMAKGFKTYSEALRVIQDNAAEALRKKQGIKPSRDYIEEAFQAIKNGAEEKNTLNKAPRDPERKVVQPPKPTTSERKGVDIKKFFADREKRNNQKPPS